MTIKEMADSCGVTKQTIRNWIKKLGADDRIIIDNGVIDIPQELVQELYRQFATNTMVNDDVTSKFTDKVTDDLPPNLPVDLPAIYEKALTAKDERIDDLTAQITFLKEQIAVKDEQIAALNKAVLAVNSSAHIESGITIDDVSRTEESTVRSSVSVAVPDADGYSVDGLRNAAQERKRKGGIIGLFRRRRR